MTERRTTITLAWRAHEAPSRRLDDFVETTAQHAPEAATSAPVRIIERRSIGRRLENWGMWANAAPSRGGRGADCMTGAICDSMRRHAVGELHPPGPVNDRIDVVDAERINRGFVKLSDDQRGILHWTYVVGVKARAVAGACGFPAHEYGARLGDAQTAIEKLVGGIGEQRS